MQPSPAHTVSKHDLFYGSFAWVVFSVVAVALRGVRWEETYEHALIITGTVPYPAGHPCFIYCRNVFSGQSYLSALLLYVIDSPLLINGYRNVLQLAFCTVPVFLLGTRFSGRTFYGHIAVVLVLAGIHQGLQSYYPIESWPHMYAIGQIGTGYALLVFALLLYGCWRSVWLLLGLMVAIHIGQLPIIGAIAGIQWLIACYRGDRVRVVQALGYFSLGVLPCVLFYVFQRTFLHVPLPTENAYAATGDIHAIWAAYTEHYDLHRGFARLNPFWKSWIGVVIVLFLAGMGASRMGRPSLSTRDHRWTAGYGALLAGVVGCIWILHQGLGGDIPYLMLGWMPYRLTNHLAILLVPLALGVLAQTPTDKSWRPFAPQVFVFLVLLWMASQPAWQLLLPEILYIRYIGNSDAALWLLCGGALAAAWHTLNFHRGRLLVSGLLLGIGALVLGWLSPFALAVTLAGFMACSLLLRYEKFCEIAGPVKAYQCIALVTLFVLLLLKQGGHREHLPIRPLQQDVVAYLAEQGESEAMLVPPYWDVAWLARTRHPIFADYQAAHHMTYIPALAPALKKMHAEVYGFTVDGPSGTPLAPWPDRSPGAWERLGEAYGFRYILAPSEMTLHLPPVLEGQPYNLYRVVP